MARELREPSCRLARRLPIWCVACRKGALYVPDPLSLARRALLSSVAVVAAAGTALAQPAADAAPLAAIMERYAAALRGNDVEALVGLYAGDGVFMRENLPAVAGTDALRAAYRDIFATLRVDLSFEIREAEVAGDMAWLRGISRGRIKVLATGSETSESFNQLIVFRRVGGTWKIRCYLYASDKPGTGTPR
jgi:ketosteroid isomerase-like protein